MEVVRTGGTTCDVDELREGGREVEVLACVWLTNLRRSSADFFAPFGVIGAPPTPISL